MECVLVGMRFDNREMDDDGTHTSELKSYEGTESPHV